MLPSGPYPYNQTRVFLRGGGGQINSALPEIDFSPPKNTFAKKYYYQTLVYVTLNSMVTSSKTVFIA